MKKGFTLIELMIAMGIFAAFIVIITGVFGRFVQVQRHSIAQGQVVVDLQSALESFIKEARTAYGSTYYPNGNGSMVAFRNQERECVAYRLGNTKLLERAVATISPYDSCSPDVFNAETFTPITGTQTEITPVDGSPIFDVFPAQVDGAGEKLLRQGVIVVHMTVSSKDATILPLSIENSVTSRQTSPYIAL